MNIMNNFKEDPAYRRVLELPCWRGPIDPQPLPGGLSNSNFRVEDANEHFVVRIGGDVPEHGLVRERDFAVSRAAYAAGIAPEVVLTDADAMVIRFIEGKTLTPEDVADARMLTRIVELVRDFHSTLPAHLGGRQFSFDAVEACRRYGQALTSSNYRLIDEIPGYLALAERFDGAAGRDEEAFCHNDLLAANLIDDGSRLWLIDWEYGGTNHLLFDLANLASNNAVDLEAEALILEAYYDRPATEDTWRRFRAMKGLSLLREAMWSMTAEMHSHLDNDYEAYTDEQLRRVSAAVEEFDAH